MRGRDQVEACYHGLLVVEVPTVNIKWQDHIESTPNVLRGKPRVKGTRIPVSLILGYLASGNTADQIISEFPDLTRDHICACLDYARALAEFEAIG